MKLALKLAYYEEHDYHTEIMGLFLDFCLSNKHTIDYFNDKDQSFFLNHYEKIFTKVNNSSVSYSTNLEINRYKNQDLLSKINDYDYVIIGTMGASLIIDNLILSYPNKFLQIYHNEDDLKKVGKSLKSVVTVVNTKKIVLTPLNKQVGPYLLPIFSFNESAPSLDASLEPSLDNVRENNVHVEEGLKDHLKNKILVMVGRFTDHRSYESLIPLLNMDYTIWIIARRPKFVPDALKDISLKNPKLKISYKLDAQKMSQILLKARYILCVAEEDSWYYKDRLTGTIPLSYNYDLPIIIPHRLNQIYDIKGSVPYHEPESIPELIRGIDGRSDGSDNCSDNCFKYDQLVKSLIDQKKSIVKENRCLLASLLSKD